MSSPAAVCLRESQWLIDLTRALVAVESPSTDREALEACAAVLATRVAETGATIARLDGGVTARPLLAEWPGQGPGVLLLGHFDTVWPIGQLARMPMREAGGKLYGPGIYDMKAGLAIGVLAARAVAETLAPDRRPRVRLFATADEEVGSAASRAHIERLARESAAVLVLEPALPGGLVKTARKGVGEFVVTTRGISSHAGADPAAGASAVHELARQVVAIEALADPSRGRSVNVGRIEGGTRSNVVAESATAVVDVRVSRLDDAPAVESAFAALRPANSRVRLEVSGGINRPPMERTAGVARLFEIARDAARELGRDLGEGSTGGASDGNFTAALGIPTLDGLGAVGDGAHALHEHVVINALPAQAALVATLLSRLVDNGITGPN